jgi:hypothetical protein
MHTSPPERHEAGIAMITVLLVTTVVLLLAITFSVVAMSERRSTAASAQTEQALQLADAGTERARREIVAAFNSTVLSISNFLSEVKGERIAGLSGVNTIEIDGTPIHWKVIDVSAPDAAYGWIDVAATAGLRSDAVQTVVRRVGFGASSTFDLAMLSETTDCMFCHLRVNGDVGNLVTMRPGWGEEGGSGVGSGGSLSGLGMSIINGNVFAAQNITKDDRGTAGNPLINGAQVTGVVEENSRNSALPVDLDGDGIPDFPPINREVAKENAKGTISVDPGQGCFVPLGGRLEGACTGYSGGSQTINGNVILEGTPDKPIRLDGDVWIEGDVVIKGYVTGIGGIYAGRNIYIAGDLQVVRAPYYVEGTDCIDETGNIILDQTAMAATGFSPSDACARQSIADNTDALRIAARGSIIVGDYTELDEAGNAKTYSQQQSAAFYREQFGFPAGGTRTYDRVTGDELRCIGGECRNADNDVVTTTVSLDGYEASFKPGQVTAAFTPWLTDAQYSEVLGRETFSHNSWRWDFQDSDFSDGHNRAAVLRNLIDAGLSLDGALEVINARSSFSGMTDPQFNNFVSSAGQLLAPVHNRNVTKARLNTYLRDSNRRNRDDAGNTFFRHWDGNALRMVMGGEREYETQVNRIDAFLYANQRIAGKTSMQAMSITGGLVARDLGILAPGRRLETWTGAAAAYPEINNKTITNCSAKTNTSYVYRSEDCALTINYDHRLRNGGYGFNIIEGRVGITLDWRLADSKQERVVP